MHDILRELIRDRDVFNILLSGLQKEEYLWRPQPGKWCLLEIICHLYDEEREDFRARTKHALETPSEPLPNLDPAAWVMDRNYINQDFNEMLQKFLSEREHSVKWLQSLTDVNWNNACSHPKLGKMTAKRFLSNWLAHDYLHIRQINRVKYEYLKQFSDEDLSYAGDW